MSSYLDHNVHDTLMQLQPYVSEMHRTTSGVGGGGFLCNFSRSTSEQFYEVAVVTGQTGRTSLIHCLSSDLPEISGFLKQFHNRFVWSLASANCTTTIFWLSSPIWRCVLSFRAVFHNKCQLFLSLHVHLPAPLGGLSTWCSRISVRLNKLIISSPIEYEFFK